MFQKKSIVVIVPAFNEEKLIGKVISTMPVFVDKIIVVNDGSSDKTEEVVAKFIRSQDRIILINHFKNEGLGKSLIDGYLKSLELGIDVIAVMAGDAQMDPADLPKVIAPIINRQANYVKGNRLLTDFEDQKMPKFRFIGNSFLTLLTKFATGYWHLIDPQCGYTAISREALKSIDIKKMTKRYGYNAHLLYLLNMKNQKVKDVEVKPVYGEAKSKIKLGSYVPRTTGLLLKLYFRRMFNKYLVREFHPLVFFYLFSFVNIVLISIPLFLYMIFFYAQVHRTSLIIFSFSTMMGFFSFFFGMWLDMEDNKNLK